MRALLLSLALTISTPALAFIELPYKRLFSIEELQGHCYENGSAYSVSACLGYIGAVMDMMREAICIPESMNAADAAGEVADLVHNGDIETPMTGELDTVGYVAIAVMQRFPCEQVE